MTNEEQSRIIEALVDKMEEIFTAHNNLDVMVAKTIKTVLALTAEVNRLALEVQELHVQLRQAGGKDEQSE